MIPTTTMAMIIILITIMQIKKAVEFTEDIQAAARRTLDYVRREHPGAVVVGVHNRRGDITGAGHRSVGYLVADPGFFTRAFQFFRNKVRRACFLIVFSYDHYPE